MFVSIFFFLFIVILFVFVVGWSLLQGILNLLFGRRKPRQSYTGQAASSSHSAYSQQSAPKNKKGKKIFDESEGEYVDFEEIKE